MAEATNIQMQQFADTRVRPRAEQIRALRAACLDDRAAIDDVYARAAGSNAWADARLDGPPHLLKAGNSSNPDDMLVFNSFCDLFEKFLAGTFASQAEANGAAAQWAVLQDACVRPLGSTT